MVKGLLDEYAATSGQLINFSKSYLCFSSNVKQPQRLTIYSLMAVAKNDGVGIYLGLSMNIGCNKYEIFRFSKDRVWGRLNS